MKTRYFKNLEDMKLALDELLDREPALDYYQAKLWCGCDFEFDDLDNEDDIRDGYIIAFGDTIDWFYIVCPDCFKNRRDEL